MIASSVFIHAKSKRDLNSLFDQSTIHNFEFPFSFYWAHSMPNIGVCNADRFDFAAWNDCRDGEIQFPTVVDTDPS